MFEIKKLLKSCYAKDAYTNIGVIHIFTSNPVYLVFSDHNYPDFIVRKLGKNKAYYLFNLCEELYLYLNEQIAKPLEVIEIKNEGYFVEKGVEGDPWFQIKAKLHNLEDWKKINLSCLTAIDDFHIKISKNPKWCKKINLSDELIQNFKSIKIVSDEINFGLDNLVKKYSEELNKLGEVSVNCQHGDYSINNVMISQSQVVIIDLEDFGIVTFPLFDEVSYALSIYLQMPSNIQPNLWALIDECCSLKVNRIGYDNQMIKAAVLFTLIFRLGSWSQSIKRQDFRAKLIVMLNDFIAVNNSN